MLYCTLHTVKTIMGIVITVNFFWLVLYVLLKQCRSKQTSCNHNFDVVYPSVYQAHTPLRRRLFIDACALESPNNRHIGDKSLSFIQKYVVPTPRSEMGIEQTRSQTTLCLAMLWLAKAALLCWNGYHNTVMAIMCINVPTIMGMQWWEWTLILELHIVVLCQERS